MINDTMLRYSPETGYPVTKVRRRRRVAAIQAPPDPLRQRVVRALMQLGAGLLAVLAAAWVGMGATSHIPALRADLLSSGAAAELRAQWASAQPVATPAAGEAWATLSIPAMGLAGEVVFEGVDPAQINVAVGHYPSTEFPWDLQGNVGLAGHREGWSEPFADLDVLSAGDTIVVQTGDATYRYTVTGAARVAPDEVWVLQDTPPSSGATGDAPLLTLTTCEGDDNEFRLVVWAELTGVEPK